MKKYIFITSVCILLASTMSAYSAPETPPEPKKTTVIVTEAIPGGSCQCIATDGEGYAGYGVGGYTSCTNPATRKYKCEVSTGLVGFQAVFASIIKYFIYIVLLLGVLGIVGLGIAWAFAGGDDIKAKTSLKTWGVNIIIGLTLLFLFSYILRALAPWVFV